MSESQPGRPSGSSKGVIFLLVGGVLILVAAGVVWKLRSGDTEDPKEKPPVVEPPAANTAPLVVEEEAVPIASLNRDAGLVTEVVEEEATPKKKKLGNRPPEKMGTIDGRVVNSFINARFGQVRSCYEARLKKNPLLSGSIDMNIGINTRGRVTGITINKDGVGDSEMLNCVKKRIRGWDFPKPEGGRVMIAKSFKFKKKT